MKMLFPGIVKLYYCHADTLDDFLREKSLSGFFPNIPSDITEVCSPTSINAENIIEPLNNGFVETAKLTFFTQEKMPTADGLCFVFSDVDGNNHLLGAKEKPFPAITEKYINGAPGESARGYEYSISLKSIKSVIKLLSEAEDSDISSLFN